jgi:hypothetical protein
MIGVIVPVRALNLQDGGHCFYEIVNLYDRGQWSCGVLILQEGVNFFYERIKLYDWGNWSCGST